MRHEGSDPSRKSAVAVFDVGKTNVKLSMVSPEGSIVETRSLPNATVDDPHWRRHDLVGTETWLLTTLAEFATTVRAPRIRNVRPRLGGRSRA